MTAPVNVHATAIVIGTTGLLFIGPSGSGKSAVALHSIEEARGRGLFAAMVSDDQVLVSEANGRLISRAPKSIAGLVEVRGAGIVTVETIEAAVLHRAIRLMEAPFAERLPPGEERFEVLPDRFLPLTRLPLFTGATAFSTLIAIHPELLHP
ncbi:HPr kinase/phosphorylase [Shinella curvata]|uniref:HPr kinase/phosphorylase n=1 Tax=Shinella curvata TaxID=1817964 RepID=A0ABT8XMH7_9HYPH|nr:HPr kinase/phosphorylase [Shinella curvata]MCJ8056538.1 HPr kinase/phosphorylase [Shinella curvata]MDO6124416.1 HPr kinase/phosphorylase [Shinella curvata]